VKVDRMGNVDNESIDPGMIQNRQTCPWYLNDLRERCCLAIGFLHFVKDDSKTALEWYAKVPALDQATNLLARQGQWNNYSRLKWGAEHGYLNAYPEELKKFKKRLRFIILMADFYYCTQNFDKAIELARRMLASEFGELTEEQDDYPQFLIASCTHWNHDRKGAFELCKKMLDDKAASITQDRAAFTAANLSWYIPDEKVMREGMEILTRMAESNRSNPYIHRARLTLGTRLLQQGDLKGGEKWLKRISGKESGYRIVAQRYLKALEEYRQALKDKKKNGG
jgi:hypothetical protein